MNISTRTLRLLIAFDGGDYSGWQRQNNAPTIQAEIERALQHMTCAEKNTVHGAGRTDAGVHAEGMVAHFQTTCKISCRDFQRGLNSILPGAIRIYEVQEVPANFHARFCAIGKEYRYTLYTGPILPPLMRKRCLHITAQLDLSAIKKSLRQLEGSHDFSSFENSGSRDKSYTGGRGAIRTIMAAELREYGDEELLCFHFTGDGFLKNMVRNMVGSLLEVGKGKISPENFAQIMEAQDRTVAGATAPPHGLCLVRVFYDALDSEKKSLVFSTQYSPGVS